MAICLVLCSFIHGGTLIFCNAEESSKSWMKLGVMHRALPPLIGYRRSSSSPLFKEHSIALHLHLRAFDGLLLSLIVVQIAYGNDALFRHHLLLLALLPRKSCHHTDGTGPDVGFLSDIQALPLEDAILPGPLPARCVNKACYPSRCESWAGERKRGRGGWGDRERKLGRGREKCCRIHCLFPERLICRARWAFHLG